MEKSGTFFNYAIKFNPLTGAEYANHCPCIQHLQQPSNYCIHNLSNIISAPTETCANNSDLNYS